MIKENTPLSMAEALEYVDTKKDNGAQMKAFISKFTKLDSKKAKELREKIEGFGNLKVSPSHISKIIDVLPEDKENLNKIFTDVSLSEDESKQILDAVKSI